MEGVLKILVLGETKTGKSTIIMSILGEDVLAQFKGQSLISSSQQTTSNPSTVTTQVNAGRDFVLKILKVNNRKVRIQLWDVAGGQNPQTALSPLFIRNACGSIIVADASNMKTLKEAYIWKKQFDLRTQASDNPCLPCALFVNHFKTEDFQEPNIQVSADLKHFCDDFQKQEGLVGVYHLNPFIPDSVQDAFMQLLNDIIEDQEKNQRTSSMKENDWDESIKLRKKKKDSLTLVADKNIIQQIKQQEQINLNVVPNAPINHSAHTTANRTSFPLEDQQQQQQQQKTNNQAAYVSYQSNNEKQKGNCKC